MEIFIVGAIDPSQPNIGGIEPYCRNLLKYLSKRQIRATLLGITPNKHPTIDEKFGFSPIVHKKRISGYEYSFRLMMKVPLMTIPTSTIIHVQRPEHLLPFILFHRKNPKVVTLHGRQLEGIRIKRRKIVKATYEKLEPFILRHADLIISVDESTREFYLREYPWLKKMRVVPTGIDLNKFRLLNRTSLRQKYGFKPEDKVIVFVGRLEKEKNLDLLIEGFSDLTETVPGAMLVFVGDGRDREHLESVVKGLELNRVVFMGAVEPDKVPEIMNCADVLALCSLIEGSPTVVKEALACGLPVVSTAVGDVSQIIKSPSAGQIISRNRKDFSRALAMALLEKETDAWRIERAKQAAEYDFERIGAMTVELYTETLNAKGYGHSQIANRKV
jgi:glycosyltransferase involved in cell wall biosynthesis